MRLTKAHIDHIITALASFERPKDIYGYLTSPQWTEDSGKPPLSVSYQSFRTSCGLYMKNTGPEGWPARILEERRRAAEDILNRVQFASLFQRVKKLSEIATSPSIKTALKVHALRAIHDMMSERERNAAVQQSGSVRTLTIQSTPERLEAARGFLN